MKPMQRKVKTMSTSQVSKRYPLPSWITRPDGRRRQLEKARWNMERIAEALTEEPDIEFTVDDLARMVYGNNCKKNRENVRKHIPSQRTYMLSRLIPIITRYGARGRIMMVKLYDKNIEEDRRSMTEELDRLKDRKEMTEERYNQMCELLGLGEK
jgi:hypothetical protein